VILATSELVLPASLDATHLYCCDSIDVGLKLVLRAEAITVQVVSRKFFLSQWYCTELSRDDASQLRVTSMFDATT